MKLKTLSILLALGTGANAAVVAQYSTFAHANNVAQISTDASAGTDWSTTALLDQATGTGAGGGTNQSSTTNRRLNPAGAASGIVYSHAREGDAGIPTGTIGESTWVTFSVAATGGKSLDFTGQIASATMSTWSSISTAQDGGTWSLYYSLNGGTTWNITSAQDGPDATVQSTEVTASLSWNLNAIGTQSGQVDFLLDAVSGGQGGFTTQRYLGFDDLIVNATAVPEPSSTALLGLGGLALMLRRRK